MLTEVLFRQMIRSDTGVVLLCVFCGGATVVVFGGATGAVDCFGRRTADDDIVD
ncbi:hypothetical protein Hanom_Chr11g01039061 [Helianthus anomalus]